MLKLLLKQGIGSDSKFYKTMWYIRYNWYSLLLSFVSVYLCLYTTLAVIEFLTLFGLSLIPGRPDLVSNFDYFNLSPTIILMLFDGSFGLVWGLFLLLIGVLLSVIISFFLLMLVGVLFYLPTFFQSKNLEKYINKLYKNYLNMYITLPSSLRNDILLNKPIDIKYSISYENFENYKSYNSYVNGYTSRIRALFNNLKVLKKDIIAYNLLSVQLVENTILESINMLLTLNYSTSMFTKFNKLYEVEKLKGNSVFKPFNVTYNFVYMRDMYEHFYLIFDDIILLDNYLVECESLMSETMSNYGEYKHKEKEMLDLKKARISEHAENELLKRRSYLNNTLIEQIRVTRKGVLDLQKVGLDSIDSVNNEVKQTI